MSEGWSADVGQAFTQAPQRTQRPRNSASGSAPGGRIASGEASAEEARISGSERGADERGADELPPRQVDAPAGRRRRGEGAVGDRVLRADGDAVEADVALGDAVPRERLVGALAVRARSGGSRCSAPGSTWIRKTAARAPRPRSAPSGHSARHHQRAIQRLAARRPRKTPPVSQAPAKVRGRWPSAPVTAERAGRRAEANERVASESGSRRPIDSVPGERGDEQRDEQQVLQPEVGAPAVHVVVGPAAEPPRHPGRQVVQRAERADPAAERAAEEDGERDDDERRSPGPPAGATTRRGRTGPRAGRARAAGGRGSDGSPRRSSGRASRGRRGGRSPGTRGGRRAARRRASVARRRALAIRRDLRHRCRLPPRGSRGRGPRPGRRGRRRPGRGRSAARPRRRRPRGRCPPPPRSTAARSSSRPPVGPLRIITRVASTTVSVGRKAAARSTSAGVDLLVQPPPAAADEAHVVLEPAGQAGERVVLHDGHVDEAVGLEEDGRARPSSRGPSRRASSTRSPRRRGEPARPRPPPPPRGCPSARRPSRRRGRGCRSRSRAARPPPRHRRTTSATTSGSVFAPCSGVRSQAMFGLTRTVSPRFTNRSIPPSAATAARTRQAGSLPRATTSGGRAGSSPTRRSRRPRALAPVRRKRPRPRGPARRAPPRLRGRRPPGRAASGRAGGRSPRALPRGQRAVDLPARASSSPGGGAAPGSRKTRTSTRPARK